MRLWHPAVGAVSPSSPGGRGSATAVPSVVSGPMLTGADKRGTGSGGWSGQREMIVAGSVTSPWMRAVSPGKIRGAAGSMPGTAHQPAARLRIVGGSERERRGCVRIEKGGGIGRIGPPGLAKQRTVTRPERASSGQRCRPPLSPGSVILGLHRKKVVGPPGFRQATGSSAERRRRPGFWSPWRG
jgi:hypothetical protein